MMKHRKILALLLAAALSVSLLASAAMAADTDAQSQATQKTDAADAVKEKPQTGAAGDSEAKTAGRSRRGCKREQVAEPEGAIGKDRAKELALADAGLSAEQTGKVRSGCRTRTARWSIRCASPATDSAIPIRSTP